MDKYDELFRAIRAIGVSAEQTARAMRDAVTGIKECQKNRQPTHNHKRKFAGHGNKKKKR